MTNEWVVERLESDLDGFHLGPVDLTLRPGEAVALLGPSGAGKTTLLRTLAGFLKLRSGRILRDGVDISDWLPEERALGYVPQGLGLFPQRTVARNIRFPMEMRGRPDAKERTEELLEQFGLESLANRYPARLSGGEQERVAIARALAADPGLIVWDEPWQGLDVLARHELTLVLQELADARRIPVVVVTHDPALAFSVADSFVVLRRGRMDEHCDASTLLRFPADAFAARFVGFENVFEPSTLEPGPAGSLRAWLRARAGSEGIAFSLAPWPAADSVGPLWEAGVRSVRPTPQGLCLEVESDGLLLTLRAASAAMPSPGDRIQFGIEPTSLQPLRPQPANRTGG